MKAKSPLDLLPKSSLDLEWWKRAYSNTKGLNTDSACYTELWEKFDKEGFCVYFCEYKYPEECKVMFMISNQIKGFLQRLETVHKYAFGTMLVLGASAPHRVVGCWLFRGQDVNPDIKQVCVCVSVCRVC